MSKYIRKTYDKFFIYYKCGFNGKAMQLSFNFESEDECNEKLLEFKQKVIDSRNNPQLNPFAVFDHYWKVKKRIKI